MSKIQDLRNPTRTIRTRLPSRKVTLDRLVDGYAIFQMFLQYGLGVLAILMATGMLYGFLLGIGAELPNFLKALLLLPLLLIRIPLPHIVGFLATGAFILVFWTVHHAYLARRDSPTPRGRRILTADQALRSATKQSTNATTAKARSRPQS